MMMVMMTNMLGNIWSDEKTLWHWHLWLCSFCSPIIWLYISSVSSCISSCLTHPVLSKLHVHPRSCFCSILRLHKRSKKTLRVETFGTYLDEISHTREVYSVVLSTWVQTCDSMWQFTSFYKSYKYIVNKHKFKYFTHANSNRWLEVFPKTSLACEDVTSPRPIPHVDFPLCCRYQGPSPRRTSYLDILASIFPTTILKLILKPTPNIVLLPKLRYSM